MAQKKNMDVESTPVLSPLRYPGGKLWLASYIERTLELNRIKPVLFVEPFAGGASIALTLLYKNKVNRIALIDRDPLVAAFWHTVFYDTDWLVEQIATLEVTLDQWQSLRVKRPEGRRDKALKCLFLNRTNYSGIITRAAGPIGGQRQESSYKIDCRFPRSTLISRVRVLGGFRDRVEFVWNCSWRKAIARISHLQCRGALTAGAHEIFYYLDPPFFNKADRLYTHHFTAKDHWMLRASVTRIGSPWILSYDAAPTLGLLYGQGQTHNRIQIQYTAAHADSSRGTKQESILAHHDILLPRGFDTELNGSKKAKFLMG